MARGLAAHPSAPELKGWLGVEEVDVGGQSHVSELLEGRNVHDPDRATMGTGDELTVPRVDLQVVDRHRWQPLHEPLPVPTPVGGDVDAHVGANEEEVRVHGVLAHHVDEVRLPRG